MPDHLMPTVTRRAMAGEEDRWVDLERRGGIGGNIICRGCMFDKVRPTQKHPAYLPIGGQSGGFEQFHQQRACNLNLHAAMAMQWNIKVQV